MTGAVILHLHYSGLARELVRRVGTFGADWPVFVTGAALDDPEVARALDALGRPVERIAVENRGRDIGAFLAVLPRVLATGAEVIVKLHTKGGGSGYGREWRERAWDRLASPEAARAIATAFADRPALGLVAAEGLFKSVSGHLFRNRAALDGLCESVWPGVGRDPWRDAAFPAGSMFWARRGALERLAAVAPGLVFEPEGGSHDGRLEHAVERGIGLAATRAGLETAVSVRRDGAIRVAPAPADDEPLIQTLARMRQARLDDLAARPIDPRAVALNLRENPLLHHVDGGDLDPNRLTHEQWRRDRRGDAAPSLSDWPAGPPASPLFDGRGAPGLVQRLAEGWSPPRRSGRLPDGALRIRIVSGERDRERTGPLVAALRRLGHAVDLDAAFDESADVCLVIGGEGKLRPLPGPVNVLVPLERTPRAAYAEFDRYDLALVDRTWAGLLAFTVRARVLRLPGAAGDDPGSVEAWCAALLEAVRGGLAAPAAPRRAPGADPAIRLVARPGSGGWPRSSAYLRLIAPLTAPRADAGRSGHRAVILDNDGLGVRGGETVVVQRDALPNTAAAERLIAAVRAAGARLTFDLDDALSLIGPDHPDHDDFAPRLAALDRIAAAAETITVATPGLAGLFPGDPRVRIVANRLDSRLWREALARPVAAPRASGPLQLLYMGTITHDADLALVFEALDRLEADRPGRFVLTLIGGQRETPDRPWLRRLAPAPAQRPYPRFVRWLGRQTAADGGPFDAGLAPLVDTPFNAGKSDLKLLDYAALGLPTLVSDTPSYAGHAAAGRALAVAPTAAAWAAAIEDLTSRRHALAAPAAAARGYLRENRLDFPEADPFRVSGP